MRPRLLFAAMLAAFVGCTALGVWWTAPRGEVVARAWHELVGLGGTNALVAIAIAVGVVATEMLRLVVFGRVLGVRIGLRAAFDASVANNLFSWISPGGMLGEPAAVVVMARRGVATDAALAIIFAKYATSVALLMGSAGALLALGYGPAIPGWAVLSIVVTIAISVVLVGGFLIGAARPATTLRWLGRLEGWLLRRPRGPRTTKAIARGAGIVRRSIERLARFRGRGWRGWLAMFGSHVLYYGSYVGLIVALAWMFHVRSASAIVPIAIIYQAFTFVAPAPGIVEMGASAFFGGLLPDGDAFVVVLLFRALTAYLHIALGLVYLPVGTLVAAVLERRRAA